MTQLHVAQRQHLLPPPRLTELSAMRPLVALWGGLATLDLGRLVGIGSLAEVTAIAVLIAVCSYGVDRPVAIGVAAIGWLLLNGFVAHTAGQLGLVGVGDAVRAAVLLVVALAAAELRR